MSPIQLDGLTKAFESVVAVDSLTFEVEEGEIFGFLGPNGAGKTTTIRTLLGLLSPTAGTASVLGADVHDERALVEAKQRIGYVPEGLGFNREVTGRRVLEYHATVKGDERSEELLDIFTPPLDRPIREYSSGNERMLGLLLGFMHDPDLVIMDEPTGGLDPLKTAAFNDFLRDERDRGTTIFFSSHVLSEVRRVCDRVGFLRDGELVALESLESLLAKGGKRVTIHTSTPVESALDDLSGATNVTVVGNGIQFTYVGEYNELLSTLANYDVRDIDIHEPPIEDVFIRYYGGSELEDEPGASGATQEATDV